MNFSRKDIRKFLTESTLLNEVDQAYAGADAKILIQRLQACTKNIGMLFEETSDLEIQNMEMILEGITQILIAYSDEKKILSGDVLNRIKKNAEELSKNAKLDVDA
jgi:hypothetical protein